MANYTTLKSSITSAIKQNGNKEITGALLQSVLLAMVNSLGAQFQFRGVATPGASPGTPDYNVAYICGPGTYPNFGNKTVPNGYIGVLKFNGSWGVELISVPAVKSVAVTQVQTTGTEIAVINVDGNSVSLYAPPGGGGGDTVAWSQVVTAGTKIAEITINGTTTEIFAPAGGDSYFETIANAASLKVAYTAGITAPQGNITAPAGVVFGKSSGKITVGTGQDFNKLSLALEYASKFSHIYSNSGNTLTIEIQDSFPIAEQLVIDGIDLSYVNITRQGYTPPEVTLSNAQSYLTGQTTYPTVLIDLINNQTFMTLRNGARGPRISCIMRAVASRNVTGIVLEGGSEIHIDPFCGLETFRTAVVVKDGSRIIARGGIVKGASSGIQNVLVQSGSTAIFPEGLFSRSDVGVIISAQGGARAVADGAFIRCAGASASFYSDRAFVSAMGLNLISSAIDAYTLGGEINIGSAGATIPVEVSAGGIIRVVDGTASTSDPLNTLSANGVIFA